MKKIELRVFLFIMYLCILNKFVKFITVPKLYYDNDISILI